MAEGPANDTADVARHHRLVFGRRPFGGQDGARRAPGIGSSLELHGFRDYVLGDDLRHVDWRGYARNDQLRVRLHEAQVAPHVDVLLDGSASMAVTGPKVRTVQDLVRAFVFWAADADCRSRVLLLGGEEIASDDVAEKVFVGTSPPAPPRVALRPLGLRVLITDALWADDPQPVLQRLAAGCSQFVAVQVLDAFEQAPTEMAAVRLVDCETGQRRELRLDRAACDAYRERLERLCAAFADAVRALGGTSVRLTAGAFATICAEDLTNAGIVEPT